ncbi:MAG TPA: hypothetical protein VM536_19925 [Chloroflexia bacterium]|nr:hypothetical protein [Chloroflexia bacterium]
MQAMHPQGRNDAQLFLVRLWAEEGSDESTGEDASPAIEWCGRLQHVVSGRAWDFRGGPALLALLMQMAGTAGPDTSPQGAGTIEV